MESLDRFVKWVQLKIYQIEVTFAIYMFTPTEKFVFSSIIFLLFGLALIATILYLPQHIVFLVNRAWFYINGDEDAVLASAVVASAKGAAAAGGGAASTSSVAGVVREL